MRVLQIHNRYRQAGGEEAVVLQHRKMLDGAGVVVDTVEMVNASGLRGGTDFVQAPWNAASRRRVSREINSFRPDLVHLHNSWYTASPSVPNLVAGLSTPLVMTIHNYRALCANALLMREGAVCTECIGRMPIPAVVHACYRDSRLLSGVAALTVQIAKQAGTWRRADLYHMPSRTAADLMHLAGVPASKTIVIPHAAADPGRREQRPSASDTVLFVGRLAEEKGIRRLLRGWSSTPKRFHLVVVGDGPLFVELKAADYERVAFLSRVAPSEVQTLMLKSRALVFPSIAVETFGSVLAEAAAAGLPVFAASHGVASEVLAPLISPFAMDTEVEIDGAAIGDALLDSALVDSEGARLRERWESTMAPEIVSSALIRAYRRLLADE